MQPLGYRRSLDGLRAVAITLVIGIHIFDFPADGELGVDIFFVLSGFLITTLLLEEKHRTGRASLPGFYRRRWRRLMPALFVLVACYTLGSLAMGRSPFTNAAVALLYVTNLPGINPAHVAPSLAPLWTLAAEEQFYLVWPAVLFIALRGQRKHALMLIAVIVEAELLAQFTIYPAHLQEFENGAIFRSPAPLLIGCAVGLLFTSTARDSLARVGRILWLPAAMVLAAMTFYRPPGYAMFGNGWIIIYAMMAAIVLVGALEPGSPIARVLGVRPLVHVGKISYSLYLWNIPVLAWLGWSGHSNGLRGVTVIALSLLAAELSYRFVEQPFRRGRTSRPVVAPSPA